MAKNLLIVESPAKCKTIKGYLGADFDVIASMGHIREIPKKGMNINIKEGFEPVYEISKDKHDIVKIIRDKAKAAEKVYLASDPDREGAAIANSVYEILDAKSQKKCIRVSFNEITKKAIVSALENSSEPTSKKNMSIVASQKARQVLDRLIGYTVSPVLWYSAHIPNSSAGRVQSIALKMICERENEIKAFKPMDFWYVEALLSNKNGEFWAKVVTKDDDNRYLDEKLANDDLQKLKKARYKVANIERKQRSNNAYPPFETATLNSACSGIFGWYADRVSRIAQSLYEKGLVSYIRTDSVNISKDAMDEVRKYISGNYKGYLSESPIIHVQKSKSAQEAHECIRPTHVENDGCDIDDADEARMYKLIRDRFIACQMKPMIIDTVVYNIKTDTKHDLVAKGQSVKFDGWFKVYNYAQAKEVTLPDVAEREELSLKETKCSKHTTQAPPRYKEGKLVEKMKKDGIGRPSTWTSIIGSLKKKGYIETIKGGTLQGTDLGMQIYEYLQPNFQNFFMDIKYTACMEEDLDAVEAGEKTYLEVVQAVYDRLTTEVKSAKQKDAEGSKTPKGKPTGVKCHKCGHEVYEKFSAKTKSNFYACSNYPECKEIYSFNDETKTFEPKTQKASTAKKTGEDCSKCKDGEIVERNGPYGQFFACNKWPKCKAVYIKNDDGNFELKPFKKFTKTYGGSKGSGGSGGSDEKIDLDSVGF